MTNVYSPLATVDLTKNSPTHTANNAMHDWQSGMKTGAEIGSIAPGVGTVVGGTIGAATGALGNAMGYGKTKKMGTDITSSFGTENPGTAIRVNPTQYNNYVDAMNYLNSYNLGNQTGVGNVGSYATGKDRYKTRELIGSNKSSNPFWQVGANTGYNVLDDYTNNSLGNWQSYMNTMNEAYGNKLSSGVDRLSDKYKSDINSQYGLAGGANAVNSANDAQMALANQLLNNIYYGGNISARALEGARKDLDKQSVGNKKNLYDIANAQNKSWQDMMGQMITNDKDAQNNQNDWIKNYDTWNKYRGGNIMDVLAGTDARANTYADNFINDDYYNALLNQSDSLLPHSAITQAYADPKTEQINPLQLWDDLLLSGKKRKANRIGEQSW